MIARKERYMKNSGSEVTTISEIAAKLKETPMVRGKVYHIIASCPLLVGRGRTAALLTGNGSKKRKLN